MDREEELVSKFLKYKGYNNIIYEPDGNIPPDFLVDNSTAIEVRRLNQHYFSGNKWEPLEDVRYTLVPKINSLLKSYTDRNHQRSAFVSINYSRPLKVSKNILKKLKSILDQHLNRLEQTVEFQLEDRLTIKIFPSSEKFESAYHFGMSSDHNAGGFVVGNVYTNLKLVLKDHQYLVVRNNDSHHQHLHIVANRVGYDGSITSDKWCKNRTARLCDHLEQEYKLTIARQHRRRDLSLDKITGKHRVKLEIRQNIQDLLDHGIRSLELLIKRLAKKGVETKLYKRRNGKAYGISFRKNNIAFKGSTIHRDLSYTKLQKQLSLNRQADRGLGL